MNWLYDWCVRLRKPIAEDTFMFYREFIMGIVGRHSESLFFDDIHDESESARTWLT